MRHSFKTVFKGRDAFFHALYYNIETVHPCYETNFSHLLCFLCFKHSRILGTAKPFVLRASELLNPALLISEKKIPFQTKTLTTFAYVLWVVLGETQMEVNSTRASH